MDESRWTSGTVPSLDSPTKTQTYYLRKHHPYLLFSGETLDQEMRLLPKRFVPNRFLLAHQTYENSNPEYFHRLVGFFEVDDGNGTLAIVTRAAITVMHSYPALTVVARRLMSDFTKIISPKKGVVRIVSIRDTGMRPSFSIEPAMEPNDGTLELNPIENFDSPNTRLTIRHIAHILWRNQSTDAGMSSNDLGPSSSPRSLNSRWATSPVNSAAGAKPDQRKDLPKVTMGTTPPHYTENRSQEPPSTQLILRQPQRATAVTQQKKSKERNQAKRSAEEEVRLDEESENQQRSELVRGDDSPSMSYISCETSGTQEKKQLTVSCITDEGTDL